MENEKQNLKQSICERCRKRESCQEICPALEEYLQEDLGDLFANWEDLGIDIYVDEIEDRLRIFDSKNNVDRPFFSCNERAVLRRLGNGKTRKEIAIELNISMSYLRDIIASIRQKASYL